MKHKIAVIASALFMALTMTACGASEPASAPSVAETDKAAVQGKLNKQDGKTDETKADDKQSDNSAVTTRLKQKLQQTVKTRISLLRTSHVLARITMSVR